LKEQIVFAAVFLDLSVSQLLRRGAISFIHLHAPEVLPEGKEVSVIEPEDLPSWALAHTNLGKK
jgi:hypothetical protein